MKHHSKINNEKKQQKNANINRGVALSKQHQMLNNSKILTLSSVKASPVYTVAIRIPQPMNQPSPQQDHRSKIRGTSQKNQYRDTRPLRRKENNSSQPTSLPHNKYLT